MTGPPESRIIHASCVALGGRGLLICGASGSGKSGLALQLMALGARLVSDDRVLLRAEAGGLRAEAPEAIAGLIEARGLGLLSAAPAGPVPVAALVDLDRIETDRLPPARTIVLMGQSVTLLHKVDSPHFAAAVLQYLKAGRRSE